MRAPLPDRDRVDQISEQPGVHSSGGRAKLLVGLVKGENDTLARFETVPLGAAGVDALVSLAPDIELLK